MITFAYNRDVLNEGVLSPIVLDFNRTPHVSITGGTGTGKTMLVKYILNSSDKISHNLKVTLLDFKHDDFKTLDGCPRYYSFLDCTEGLDNFYKAFQARQRGEDNSRNLKLLVFDELASYLNTLSDKKVVESEKLKISTLLMLGRSFNFHVLVSQQRFDASFFGAGARDQFSLVVALGNISKEAAQMFGFDRDKMQLVSGFGAGYALINGEQVAVQVPTIRDIHKLDEKIRQLISK